MAVGNCVHDILRRLHEPLLESMPNSQEERRNYIEANWQQVFHDLVLTHNMESKLPVFSWLYFEKAAPEFIKAYFMEQPMGIQPMLLEETVQTELGLGGERYTFSGTMDRIDKRDGKLVILDYKTGKPRENQGDFWNDEEFFRALNNCLHTGDFASDNLLDELREKCPDVQLPTYFLMGVAHFTQEVANAAFVWLLRTHGHQEDFILGETMERKVFLERCAGVLTFLIGHMRYCAEFWPVPEKCDYCEYREACYTAEFPKSASLEEANI